MDTGMSLQEYLDAGDVAYLATDEDNERYRVGGEREAVWAMRKLAAAQRKIAEHQRTADAEVERIRAWEHQVCEPLQRDCAFFAGLLTDYHARNIIDDLEVDVRFDRPDREVWDRYRNKTLKLPNGEVCATRKRGTFDAYEEGAATQFLIDHKRVDLLYVPDAEVRASILEDAIDDERDIVCDGEDYWLCVGYDVIHDFDKAVAIQNAIDRHVDVSTIFDTFVDDLKYCIHAFERHQASRLRVAQQLGSEPFVSAWAKIPGIRKRDAGRISIETKVNDDDDNNA